MASRSFTGSHFVSQTVTGMLYGILMAVVSAPFGRVMINHARSRMEWYKLSNSSVSGDVIKNKKSDKSSKNKSTDSNFVNILGNIIAGFLDGIQWMLCPIIFWGLCMIGKRIAASQGVDLFASVQYAKRGCVVPEGPKLGVVFQGPLLRVSIFSTTRNSTPEIIASFGVEFRLVEKILTLTQLHGRLQSIP